jgi:hypothetical protein
MFEEKKLTNIICPLRKIRVEIYSQLLLFTAKH